MAGIRVNSGIKKIEVNDNGDYITLSLSDNAFLERFFSLYENIQKMAEESAAAGKEINDKGMTDNSSLREVFRLYDEAGEKMRSELDGLFGEGTCKKVFGDITPGLELYLDFFEQLTPYLQEFAQEKRQRLSKYSPQRTGNV